MTLETKGTLDVTHRSRLISEFNYLKIAALVLLIFVHSDLVISYPNVMYPVMWFLLSAFFFISGYLVYDSFTKRKDSIWLFFKSKIKSLYIPFLIAVIVYFVMATALGVSADPIKLVSQVSMMNIFYNLNSVYNWSSLWFIPILLCFMLIICLLEKYVTNTKIQITVVSAVWLVSMLLWVFNTPFRLDQLFSQFLLVFAFGFYINKLKLYEKMMNYKMAFCAVPLVIFFSIDLSGYFTFDNQIETLTALFYANVRSIVLTLGLVLLVLLFLRKIKVPKNGFAKKIASKSAFIYLSEPLISFMILAYVFGQADSFFASGVAFYVYQAVRIVVLLVGMPLMFVVWQKYRGKKDPVQVAAVLPK